MICPKRHFTCIDDKGIVKYVELDCLGEECALWDNGQCCEKSTAIALRVRKI